MAQKFLCVYHDWLVTLKALGYERAGRLLISALEYDIDGTPPDLDGNLKFVWPLIQSAIDRNHEHYKKICETNRNNVTKRYDRIPPNTTVYDGSKENIREEKTIEDKKREPKAKADAFAEFAGDNADLLKALQEFKAMRSQIKKPLTPAAQDRLLSKLKKDFSPAEWIPVLNQSVDHCWQDIYPLKTQAPNKPASTSRNIKTESAPTVEEQVKKYGPIDQKIAELRRIFPDAGKR